MSNDVSSVRNFCSLRNGNGIRGRVESGRGWERGRAENSVCKARGRVGKSSGLLVSGKHTSRYGGFSSNGNNNTIKHSARNVRGWVSESNVSSVRNGNGIRGRVESGRGWERGRAENSVRKTRGRGRVGKSSCRGPS